MEVIFGPFYFLTALTKSMGELWRADGGKLGTDVCWGN